MTTHHSEQLFEQALSKIPGGVNSPVRAFKGVGGTPIFIERSEGPYLYDVDGNRYIDYVGSWGPMILGHQSPIVLEAIKAQLEKGISFGTATAGEIELAKMIVQLVPSIEQVRLVNSGTEATMSAIRLARAYTQRDKLIKFEGCYHGHSDSLLVKAGSGALTLGHPSSPGIPLDTTQHTLTAQFNDLSSVATIFEHYPEQIAAIIVEPIAGNMNLIAPQAGFLEGLRQLCDQHHAVLIFDEVMTGFRVALGGAQTLYGITPDLTTLGKIIGGGLPVGAFGGKKEIMSMLAPQGPVYQAGTLSGNPLAVAAGLATLKAIQRHDFFNDINAITHQLCEGMQHLAHEANIPFHAQHVGGLFGFYFTESQQMPQSYSTVTACDLEKFQHFFHLALEQGLYFAPSMYEAGFTSIVHTREIITETLRRIGQIFRDL